MAGYWPSSSFCVFMDRDEVEVHTFAKKERGEYPVILTEQTWSIKDLLCGFRGNFACGIQRVVHLARSGSQSQRVIWVILPAHGASHIIICTYWLSGRAGQENVWLEVRTFGPCTRAKYFTVRPDLTQSIKYNYVLIISFLYQIDCYDVWTDWFYPGRSRNLELHGALSSVIFVYVRDVLYFSFSCIVLFYLRLVSCR